MVSSPGKKILSPDFHPRKSRFSPLKKFFIPAFSSPEKSIHPQKSKFYPPKKIFIPNVLRDENFYPGIEIIFPGMKYLFREWNIYFGDKKIFLGDEKSGDENFFSRASTCFPGKYLLFRGWNHMAPFYYVADSVINDILLIFRFFKRKGDTSNSLHKKEVYLVS